jgi:sugar lactone lactonase YvrE
VLAVSTLIDRPALSRYSASPIAPEALALAPDGSVYVANAVRGEVVRINAGGSVLERLPTSGHTAGVLLGGDDGRTLFAATIPTLDPDRLAGHHSGRIEIIHLAEIEPHPLASSQTTGASHAK